MNSTERAVHMLSQDVFVTWGDLHDEAKSLRVSAKCLYEQAVVLERKIDQHLQLLSDSLAKFPDQKTPTQ